MTGAKRYLAKITTGKELTEPENSHLNVVAVRKGNLGKPNQMLGFFLIERLCFVGITQCVCQRVGSVQTEVCIWRQTTTGWPSIQHNTHTHDTTPSIIHISSSTKNTTPLPYTNMH